MKIQVGGLSEGTHRYRFASPATEIGLGKEFPRDAEVEATLEKTGNQFYLDAVVHATGAFQCDRCVAEFTVDLSPRLRMIYLWEGGDAAHFDPAEVQIIAPGSTVIDITEDVRQTLMLAVPLKLLCRDSCKGLCPQCGKNLNEGRCACTDAPGDSRWERLRSIQKN
jgi:uncharacterized protein